MSDGRRAVGLGWPGEVPATAAGLGWPGDASPGTTGDRATAFAVPNEVPVEGVSTEVNATVSGLGSGQNGGMAT
jgi:hypothetical protein